MNKQEAIKAAAQKTGLTQVDTAKTLSALEEVIYETLAKGERIQLTGLVTFAPVARAARKGFDPTKGVPMDIPPTVGVSTKAGQKTKQAVEGLKFEDVKKGE
ncbi:DNA-binding protein HU [compost metagenome]